MLVVDDEFVIDGCVDWIVSLCAFCGTGRVSSGKEAIGFLNVVMCYSWLSLVSIAGVSATGICYTLDVIPPLLRPSWTQPQPYSSIPAIAIRGADVCLISSFTDSYSP